MSEGSTPVKRFNHIKLDIPSRLESDKSNIEKNIEKHTITPRCLSKREYIENTDNFPIFTETYDEKDTKVQRHGMDTSIAIDTWNVITALTQVPKSTNDQISNVTEKSLLGRVQLANVEVSKIEQSLLKLALETLKTNNVVLVDMFERDFGTNRERKDGAVKFKDGEALIHCIALYKQPTSKEVLIIDPSNSDFSLHIKHFIEQSNNEAQITVSTIKGGIKIYSVPEGKALGYTDGTYRNCIDIAVKIALKLVSRTNSNDITATPANDTYILKELGTIPNEGAKSLLSRLNELYTKTPMQFLQTSSSSLIDQLSNKFELLYKNLIKDKISEAKYEAIKKDTYIEKLTSLNSTYLEQHSLSSDDVNGFFKETIQSMDQVATTSHASLLGEVLPNETQTTLDVSELSC